MIRARAPPSQSSVQVSTPSSPQLGPSAIRQGVCRVSQEWDTELSAFGRHRVAVLPVMAPSTPPNPEELRSHHSCLEVVAGPDMACQ